VAAEANASGARRPSVVTTLGLLVGTVIFMAGIISLYSALNIGMFNYGMFFLLYWAAILHQERSAYFPSLLGGVLGTLLGGLLLTAPTLAGAGGAILSNVLLVTVLFCYMRGHVRLLVNNATMLFMTASTIPELNVANNVFMMVKSLILAAAYMGGISFIAGQVVKRISAIEAAINDPLQAVE